MARSGSGERVRKKKKRERKGDDGKRISSKHVDADRDAKLRGRGISDREEGCSRQLESQNGRRVSD